MAEMNTYVGAKVRKHFPGYAGLFEGTVTKVDTRDQDRPIFIKYEDGDKEWISFKELLEIVVKDDNKPSSTTKAPLTVASRKRLAQQKDDSQQPPAKHSARSSSPGLLKPDPAKPAATKPTRAKSVPSSSGPAKSQPTANVSPGPQAGPSTAPHVPPGTPATEIGDGDLRQLLHDVAATAERSKEPEISRLQPSSGATTGPPRFCQVVLHNNICYIAGQTAEDSTSESGRTYAGQIQQVLAQLDQQLAAAGTSKQNLLQVRVYLLSIQDGAAEVNRQWEQWLSASHLPARTLVEVTALARPGLLVEVDGVAALPTAV